MTNESGRVNWHRISPVTVIGWGCAIRYSNAYPPPAAAAATRRITRLVRFKQTILDDRSRRIHPENECRERDIAPLVDVLGE
jgi:hypothetical protein